VSDAMEARRGWPSRGGGKKLVRDRAALARLLWDPSGKRRLPSTAALDRALARLPRSELEWIFEFNPLAPLYLLPTSEWVRALAKSIERLGARRVLEVAAGDGFLSSALRRAAPGLRVWATDSGTWEKPSARMNRRERESLAGRAVPGLRLGKDVRRMEALEAIRRYHPDLVLAAWLPPGRLLDRLIRAPSRWVLEIGAAGGVTPGQWSWRFDHEFLEGPIERLARCRLDRAPAGPQSRVTLYYGAAHEQHRVERPRRGDWLWQFRPET